MGDTIYAITLNIDHPEWNIRWTVGDNCDKISFGFLHRRAWYQPLVRGVSKAFYWAEDIEKVYYYDKIVESITRYSKD